jgi:Flp pilus assembly protein TadD
MAAQPSSARNPQQNRGLIQAYLSLSQIAEQRKDFKLAESWLNKISSSEDMIRAQSRRASLLAIQGKLEDGIELIRALPERSVGDARLKIQAEVQLLRDNKKFQAAFDLLAKATTQNPTDYDFLYDQATLAEKLGNPDEMETLLRRIIAGKPDFHHAYNALGYSFAERNIRLPEARQLIIKALEFAPNDPFITDSLGWVEFRMGNKAEALRILQGAYKSRPDPEIAAHLGEVLWSMGKRDEARKIWKEGVALAADNETLVETLKRFRVKP